MVHPVSGTGLNISQPKMTSVKIGRDRKFDLNPRGNLWMEDQNKYGHKLLLKMGWSQGKGLGKKENGITENIKVKTRTRNTGLGWTKKLPVAIAIPEYEAVLENLNKKFQNSSGNVVKTDDLKSIEERSYQFKNRLHYQKFIKVKDVSRYSDKDMNGIFISKAMKSEPESVPVETTVTNVVINSADVGVNGFKHIFKSELSTADYFTQKLKNKFGESSKTNINSKEEPQCVEKLSLTESQVNSKKRKKELSSKKSKKYRLSEPEIIDHVEENSSNQKVHNDDMDEEHSSEIFSNKIFKEAKLSRKESKKHKKDKVHVLKSCMKKCLKNSTKFWFDKTSKEVSFSDNVSCKIIEDDCDELDEETLQNEATETVVEFLNFNSNDDESSETTENKETSEINNSNIVNANSTSKEFVKDELFDCTSQLKKSVPDDVKRSKGKHECLDLPKCSSSNYNCWLESQRIALKMKIYTDMCEAIETHSVLCKTNLLQLKGYGNWGF
ncbi:hypothetical protein NPIL_664881 [Nephila pilipes]|uniref:G-patch domain-containing protein n=1 Tax=Nephila pilipes TaxID=299642 RepID=A0A8X6QEJ3_NEPPI|nr:hypothetical protein NPIL_664881 [Nephila pilipes]